MAVDDALLVAARDWLAADPDPVTRNELDDLIEAALAEPAARPASQELAATVRRRPRLRHGRASRGKLGAGPNRMNLAVVTRAANGIVGLARASGDPTPRPGGVAVCFDARHRSADFAEAHRRDPRRGRHPGARAPRAAAHAGARLSRSATSSAAAGVMVTASHNPPQDNGYKVYDGDRPPDRRRRSTSIIAAAIGCHRPGLRRAATPRPTTPTSSASATTWSRLRGGGRGRGPGARAASTCGSPTPRCTGWVRPRSAGCSRPPGSRRRPRSPSRSSPTPTSPRLRSRTPRSPAPSTSDSPRPARPTPTSCWPTIPTPTGSVPRCPTRRPPAAGGRSEATRSASSSPTTCSPTTGWSPAAVFATTIVSSTLLSKMAAAAGVPYVETLTGFKWIGRAAGDRRHARVRLRGGARLLRWATSCSDKDGITAAVEFAEAVAALARRGPDRARRARRRWPSATASTRPASGRCGSTGADGMATWPRPWRALRATPPAELAGRAVSLGRRPASTATPAGASRPAMC